MKDKTWWLSALVLGCYVSVVAAIVFYNTGRPSPASFAFLGVAAAFYVVLLLLPRKRQQTETHCDFVVNNRGELGFRHGDQLLWFFRGRPRQFKYGYSADGDRMQWRRCSTNEFGDRILVPGHVFGTKYSHGEGWQPMPAIMPRRAEQVSDDNAAGA